MAAKTKGEVLRGIAIGDLHLDKLVKIVPRINHIIIDYCRKLLRKAVDDRYDIALFLGDIFNYSSGSEEATRLLLELLVEFQHQIEIVLLEGNHGYKRNGQGSLSSLSLLEEFKLLNVQLITKPRVIIRKNVPLLLMPHPYTSVRQIAKDASLMWSLCVESGLIDANSYEQADSLGADVETILYNTIAFGHFTRSGSIRDNGTKSSDGVAHETGADSRYYINGHLHTPQILGTHTYYPGTFYQTSFGESEEKGYGRFVAKMSGNNLRMNYEHVPVKPPIRLVNIMAANKSQLPKKYEANTYYKITPLSGFEIPEEVAKLKNVITAIGSTSSVVSSKSKEGDEDDDDTGSLGIDLMTISLDYIASLGLSDKQLRLGKKLINKAKDELGIEI